MACAEQFGRMPYSPVFRTNRLLIEQNKRCFVKGFREQCAMRAPVMH